MGNVVDRNTLRTMILEIFIKDKALFIEIANDMLKEDPMLLRRLNNISGTDTQIETQNDDISDEEFDRIITQNFEKYDAVFRALA
jgi:hypothetical protein